MGTVSTQLESQARSIFDELGYTVSQEGEEFTAERKWRVVHVTPMPEPGETPTSGEFRCFVTPANKCSTLKRRLARVDPGYEWAILSVETDGSYEVCAATTIE